MFLCCLCGPYVDVNTGNEIKPPSVGCDDLWGLRVYFAIKTVGLWPVKLNFRHSQLCYRYVYNIVVYIIISKYGLVFIRIETSCHEDYVVLGNMNRCGHDARRNWWPLVVQFLLIPTVYVPYILFISLKCFALIVTNFPKWPLPLSALAWCNYLVPTLISSHYLNRTPLF